jgi:zinc D-Ala-D-Ala carboxypeptidase
MQLTTHFSLEALSASATALRLGIDNTPPDELIPNAQRLAMGLEQVQMLLLARLHHSSGFRCEALEKVLTAKDFAAWCVHHAKDLSTAWPEYFERKQHPQFKAEDFTCPDFGTPQQIVEKIAVSDIQFDQLIEEGTWVHISFSENPRREVLAAKFKDGTPTYSRREENERSSGRSIT